MSEGCEIDVRRVLLGDCILVVLMFGSSESTGQVNQQPRLFNDALLCVGFWYVVGHLVDHSNDGFSSGHQVCLHSLC